VMGNVSSNDWLTMMSAALQHQQQLLTVAMTTYPVAALALCSLDSLSEHHTDFTHSHPIINNHDNINNNKVA